MLDSINLGSTTFNDRAWSPYGSQIHIPESYFKDGDPSKELNLSDPYTVGVFAHEALHVWQRITLLPTAVERAFRAWCAAETDDDGDQAAGIFEAGHGLSGHGSSRRETAASGASRG